MVPRRMGNVLDNQKHTASPHSAESVRAGDIKNRVLG